MSEFPDHPFWDYSLNVYMKPGVGAACLELQDAHQLDVNIVLFCSWVGASGRGVMEQAEMAAAVEAVDAWHHDVVHALRAVRTRMKGGMPPAPDDIAESLRQRIQKVEIDCEHMEQLMLAGTIDRPADEARALADRASDAAANIARYFAQMGRTASPRDCENLAVILRVAFPDVPPDDVARIGAAIAS